MQWVKNLISVAQVVAEVWVQPLALRSGFNDLVLPQLQHRLQLQLDFNPWPRNSHMLRVWPYKEINVMNHINGLRKRNHMIVSTDKEKVFDKIQYPYIRRTLSKRGLQRNFCNLIKGIDKKYLQLTHNFEILWK